MTSESLDLDELLAHSGWVRSLAIRLLRDTHAADDVVQDTWVAALRHPPEAGRPLRPWLATVVRNLVRRRHRTDSRRSRREQEAPERSPAESGDELLAAVEEQQRLAQDVVALPEPYRGVLLRRFWRGEEPAAIARALGVPAATVRSQLHRGLGMLRERVKERFGGDGRAMGLALFTIGGEEARRLLPPVTAAAEGIWIMNEATKIGLAIAASAGALVGGWKLWGVWSNESVEPPLELARESSAGHELAVEPEGAGAAPAEVAPATAAERRSLAAPRTAAPVEVEEAFAFRARLVSESRVPLKGGSLSVTLADRESRSESDDTGHVLVELDDWSRERFEGDGWTARLEARAPGRVTRFFPVVGRPVEDGSSLDLGEVVLDPGGQVSGRVVDGAGRPRVDVLVRAADLPLPGNPEHSRRAGPEVGDGLPEARSDASGRFWIDGVQPGDVRLWATGEDGSHAYSEGVSVTAGHETSGVDLILDELAADQRIAGRVVNEELEGIAGIYVMYQLGGSFASNQVVQTGAGGDFEIVALEAGRHTLTIDDGSGAHSMRVVEGVMPGTTDLEIVLSPARFLDLRVVDTDGRPIEDFEADAQLVRGFYQVWTRTLDSERADARRISVPNEPYTLSVDAPGYVRAEIGPLDPATGQELQEVVLERAEVFHGRVTHAGEPLEGARVSLHFAVWNDAQIVHEGFVQRIQPRPTGTATTDAEGRFELERPDWGQAVLLAEHEGLAGAEAGPFPADASLGGGVDIELSAGGAIAGRVHPLPGQAPRGLLVSATRGDGRVLTTRTDEEGGYRFDGLTPGDWYVVWHERESKPQTSFSSSAEPLRFEGNCRVLDGRESLHDIDLAGRPTCVLSGRLLFDGEAPTEWTATLERLAGAPLYEPWRPVGLDAEGRFELEVPQGAYRLVLERPEAGETVRRLEQRLELDRERASWSRDIATGSLSGRVPAEGSAPLVRLGLAASGGPDWELVLRPRADGSFEVDGLPAGRHSLHVMEQRDGDPFERWHALDEVEVVAGEAASYEPR